MRIVRKIRIYSLSSAFYNRTGNYLDIYRVMPVLFAVYVLDNILTAGTAE